MRLTNPWHDAVLEQCMSIECCYREADPRGTVKDLIDWHAQLATDPLVSSKAQALIERGRAMVREGYEAISTDLARQLDALIAEAIDRVLGRGCWSLETLKGRLTEVSWLGDQHSKFFLDNSQILVLEHTKMNMEGGRLVARRRVLWMTP